MVVEARETLFNKRGGAFEQFFGSEVKAFLCHVVEVNSVSTKLSTSCRLRESTLGENLMPTSN